MKKILFPILILGIILSMSDCSNDNENAVSQPAVNQPQEPDYYPYEVTNLQYTKFPENSGYEAVFNVTWDNPTDPDFLKVKHGHGIPNTDPFTPNSTGIFKPELSSLITFYCISKDGRVSKGVDCYFDYPGYPTRD